MAAVRLASIVELCEPDHGRDAVKIAAWTANRSPEHMLRIMANPAAAMFVAERNGGVAAVGCVNNGAEITLNYVHPAHRFRGVSKALLAAMEDFIRDGGVREAKLTSTATARRFYAAAGWIDDPDAVAGPLGGHPMRKTL